MLRLGHIGSAVACYATHAAPGFPKLVNSNKVDSLQLMVILDVLLPRYAVAVVKHHSLAAQIAAVLKFMKRKWPGHRYDLITFNCCHFC